MIKLLYNLFITILYIPYICIIYFRIFLKKEHKSKYKEKIFLNKHTRPKGFLFWFHVASIGELNSIFPIIDFYIKKNNKYNFIITSITLSSFYEYKKKYGNNNRVHHQFLPYDFEPLIENFFRNWKPDFVSFVDSEIWPNFILKIKKKKLPFVLLNARITNKSFKRWFLIKNFAKKLFNSFSLCIASSEETKNYLNFLNAKKTKFFGNIKFCSSINILKKFNSDEINPIKDKKTWCAISTHNGEEIICANIHKILKKTQNDLLTIIIPRHIHRNKKICLELKKMGLKVQIKNENQPFDKSAEIILVNYFGSVKKYLNSFKQVFIGKSFLKKLKKVGGQNPIDAVKFGCSVYHGPYVSNFKEIYKHLDTNKFSYEVQTPEELEKKLIENFKEKLNKDHKNIEKLNIYSAKIFDNVIKEYENLLNANFKT